MTGRYASGTTVSVERSIGELRTIMTRYGVKEIGILTTATAVDVLFTLKGRNIKISIALPRREETQRDAAGRPMRFSKERYEKAVRQRWRALLLLVKARLEAIELGIETVEQAFMPYLLLPDGKTTVGDAVIGQITGGALPLLGSGS